MAFDQVGPGYFGTMQSRIRAGASFCPESAIAAFVSSTNLPRTFSFRDSRLSANTSGLRMPNCFPSRSAAGLSVSPRTPSMPAFVRRPCGPSIFRSPPICSTKEISFFLIRSAIGVQATDAYLKSLSQLAPTTPLYRFVTLEQQLNGSLGPQRLITVLSAFLAYLALLLSALGLYGLLAANVAQRTNEIGIRIALGAARKTVIRMFVAEACRLLVFGILLGLAPLIFVLHAIGGMLYDVSPFDTRTLLTTVLVLTVVAMCAALIPARRAASTDPMNALRIE